MLGKRARTPFFSLVEVKGNGGSIIGSIILGGV